MKLSSYVDPKRCFQLVSGIVGIYLSYLVSGILHQSMLKSEYVNDITQKKEKFEYASAFLIYPCGIAWLIGAIVNHNTIQPLDRTHLPRKHVALCGLTVAISTFTYTYAIYLTNFPVVMMFKSCNILSVILVGVLCSRVKDKKLKLGMKKIVVGLIVTLGIILFKLADPTLKKSQKETEFFGIILLIVSLLADGFLPDFQAHIKSQYKPQPMEMMAQINKWVTILSFIYACTVETFLMDKPITGQLDFIVQHRLFLLHLIGMGILSTIGQMFVYRMIKQFKQHFVPFVITTRKIFTVGLSIIVYKHATNVWQLLGLLLVFGIVTYEFVSELMSQKKHAEKHFEEQVKPSQLKASNFSITQVEPQPQSRYEQQQSAPTPGSQLEIQNQKYQMRLNGQDETDEYKATTTGKLDEP